MPKATPTTQPRKIASQIASAPTPKKPSIHRSTNPSAPRITIIDLARELGVWRNAIFRVLPRLGIRHRLVLDPTRSHNLVATISRFEADLVSAHLSSPRKGRCRLSPDLGCHTPVRKSSADEVGYFYLLQLEPTHDPLRLKLGFTNNLPERLRAYRTALPFANYLRHWPCRRNWEQAAIHCIARDCERLHTEVVRAKKLKPLLALADAFFLLMPDLTQDLLAPAVQTQPIYKRR